MAATKKGPSKGVGALASFLKADPNPPSLQELKVFLESCTPEEKASFIAQAEELVS